jgi:predicted SnoaL-like aldol condensation-catalyzing enzyme
VGPKLYNAVRLYIDGVRDGHLSAALDKYVAENLVQHTPGIPAGRDGLAALFRPLVDRYERRTVVPLRGFEHGSRVFLHTFACYGHRAVERVTMDIFDTDADDQIVAHWSVSAPLLGSAGCGASPIDGPRIAERGATETNVELVRAFLATGGPTGIEHGHPVLGSTRVTQMAGHGTMVAAIGVRDRLNVADLFRVDAGRIVEHWDVRTPGGLG